MKKLLLLGLFSIILQTTLLSQSINTDPYNNRVIQKYYTKNDLTATQDVDYAKFKWIKYYYIHSFIIDETTLAACPTFDPQLFDVNDYNHLRVNERRITFTTPCGVTITLLSGRELELLIHYDGVLPAPTDPTQTDR